MSIAEVAKAAGVSTATVSRVLNDLPGVREETIQQVRAAVAALRYTPLRVRRTPKQSGVNGGGTRYAQRTGNIAAITLGQSGDWLRLPVMAAVVSGMQRAVGELGVRLILDEVRDPSKPSTTTKGMQIDGAVIFLSSQVSSQVFDDLITALKKRVPVVRVMGLEVTGAGVDHVAPNNIAIGEIANQFLTSRHCERVGYLTTEPEWGFMKLRGRAFLAAAAAADKEATAFVVGGTEKDWVAYGSRVISEPTIEALIARIAALGDLRPDGLFIANDLMTATAYPLLSRYGLKPGEEVTIISCDNEEVRLSALHPRPATIEIGAEEIGFRAVMRLKGRAQHPDSAALLIQVAPKLVIPGSAND